MVTKNLFAYAYNLRFICVHIYFFSSHMYIVDMFAKTAAKIGETHRYARKGERKKL